MGNSIQATTTTNTIASFTSFANKAVSTTNNTAITNCSGVNLYSITTGRDCEFRAINSNLSINQTTNTNCQITATTFSNLSVNFKEQIQNIVRDFITQDLTNKQGFFSTGFSLNIANASNTEDITNLVSNTLSAEVTQLCSTQINSFNTAILDLCGYYENVNLSTTQNALTSGLVSCAAQNVINAFITDGTLNNFYNQTNQKLASEQTGPLQEIGGWLKWLIIGGVILAFLIIIGVIIFVFIGGPKKVAEALPMISGKERERIQECALDTEGERKGRPEMEQKEILEKCIEKKRESEEHPYMASPAPMYGIPTYPSYPYPPPPPYPGISPSPFYSGRV